MGHIVPAKKLSHQKSFEDSKGIIRSRKSKDRQYNGQTKNDKRTNSDVQIITLNTEDQAKRTQLKLPVNSVHAPHVAHIALLLLQTW